MRRNRAVKTGLALSTGLIAAAALAAPAQADPIDPSFLSSLGAAGVNVGDPAATTALGQSVCPMLTAPAGTAASTYATVSGDSGMDPEMAQTFTEIAVDAYCPQMLSQLANGQVPDFSQIPGLGGTGSGGGFAIPAIPGLPAGIPVVGGR
ncbi:DUF732 domain-containing protein [Mycobacterium sp. M1]|uniref:DUF732 domain-containing protein n=1 Tax=Mycolicibacter acidiphilus TaxID=2835306 RepID=A0ABS5RJ88_9MYCO|nr:DUF732 domain-containing protein [Mycolicibacter acidiphilus]MBS9534072.1 DUF732 domain-containing protein [Mycolicibacter acidiphilus]